MMATPSEVPIWRLVEAIPEATPAWENGMPDTAAWVMGALTMPDPRPKTANAMTMCSVDHDVVIPDSRMPPAAIPAPATSVGARPPQRASIRLEATAPTAITAAIGTMCRPASRADMSRTSWRYKVARNRKPPRAAKALIAVGTAPANGALRKNLGSSTGSVRRAS